MNELSKLSGKDLLANERVKIVARKLGIDLLVKRYSASSGLITVNRSLADVAFEMRDKLNNKLRAKWHLELRYQYGTDIWALKSSKPEHWIIAAVLAWEATQ